MLEKLKQIKELLAEVNNFYLKCGNSASLQELNELKQIINILKMINENS